MPGNFFWDGRESNVQNLIMRPVTNHIEMGIANAETFPAKIIRQVFNFSNTTADNSNPYLISYSINSARTGWGLRLGAGYSHRQFTTDDGITSDL